MSNRTIYTCDRCKAEFTDRSVLGAVSAFVGEYYGDQGAFKSFRQDWCFNCLSDFGLPSSWKKNERAVPVQPPTLEDLIREIVRQEQP